MDRLMDVVSLFSIALIVTVLISLRRAHIRVEYSVGWLAAAVLLLLLSRSVTALDWLAGMLGAGNPALALLLSSFCIFLLLFYRFSISISKLKDANTALTQRLAILQHQIETLHAESKTPGQDQD